MPVDYHMHTFLSDGKDSHEDMVASAIFQGLTEMGFSDHISVKPIGWAMPIEQIGDMVKRINAVQSATDPSQITIRLGAEVDFFPGQEKEIAQVINSAPFDYVIGSVHFVGDWNFDADISPYDLMDIDRFYHQYFELLQMSARSGLFDIIGHCDLAKKFGYRPSFPLDELYSQTAQIFKESGVAVELNTSGRIKPCNEFYPSANFLHELVRHKVPIALGSDAHVEQNVAQFFNDALTELRLIGVKELVTYEQRKRGSIRI